MPTIVTSVPRAAFASVAGRLRREVTIPVVASNRINMPDEAERHPRSAATPTWCRWRARSWPTPHFVAKAASGRADEINTCIGCNQACLDHTFANKRASCLVNPRACHETELVYAKTAAPAQGGGGRRRAGRPVGGHAWRPNAATTVTLFDSERQRRRPVQDRHADSGQGRIHRDHPLLLRASWS